MMFKYITNISVIFITVIAFPFTVFASENINDAFKQNTTAIILASHSMAKPVERIDVIIRDAIDNIPNAKFFNLDVLDPANADLVREHRLAGAPMPLVLVVVSGTITGGIPAERASTELLLKMIPSPKQLELIQAVRKGKAAFIIIEKRGSVLDHDFRKASEAACQELQGNALIVEIDKNDPVEKEFLALLQLDTSADAPAMIVTNNHGQVINQFTSPVSVDDLVQAATTIPRGFSCAPGCAH
ncbi:MAG: hypothetical protein EOM12_10100 [Verrucomicrobiae bacterium]|nr:hypothetical protein [Verrucomicrobiae bacterium]